MRCKSCLSVHKQEIDSMLRMGYSTYKISDYLMDRYKEMIDHNSINNHRNNHLLPLEQGSDIIKMLYNTGNSRLARAIMRTQKIIKKCYKCVCEVSDRSVKRKGIVYIYQLCKG